MYCPRCGVEYRKGFTECADCGVALVTNKPADPPHDPVNFMTILETRNANQLAIAKTLLQDAHIPYFVRGDTMQNILAVDLARLQVAEARVEQAREILADLIAGHEDEREGDHYDDWSGEEEDDEDEDLDWGDDEGEDDDWYGEEE